MTTVVTVQDVEIEVTEDGRFKVPGSDVVYDLSWHAVEAAQKAAAEAAKKAKKAARANAVRRPRPTKPRMDEYLGLPLWLRTPWEDTVFARATIIGIIESNSRGPNFRVESTLAGALNSGIGEYRPDNLYVATSELVQAILDAEERVRTIEARRDALGSPPPEVSVAGSYTIVPRVEGNSVLLTAVVDGEELTGYNADQLEGAVQDVMRKRTHTPWLGWWFRNEDIAEVTQLVEDERRWTIVARALVAVAQPGAEWRDNWQAWAAHNRDLIRAYRAKHEAYLDNYRSWRDGK